jgi:ferredoxin-NADP reductase
MEADSYVYGPAAFLRDMNCDLISMGAPQDAIIMKHSGPKTALSQAYRRPKQSPRTLRSFLVAVQTCRLREAV